MITDALLQLSTAQAVTVTANSTYSIDLGVNRDIAVGDDLYAIFNVDESVTAAGAATVTFQVVTSASADLSSPTIIAELDAVAKTELTAGRKPLVLAINPSFILAQPIGQRYLGVIYSIATGPLTAGKFSAVITDSDVNTGAYYPSGFSVA
jgi:hypothetical protein